MGHCIFATLTKLSSLKEGVDEKRYEYLNQDIIAVGDNNDIKPNELFIDIRTDYFGGFGEQSASLHKNNIVGTNNGLNIYEMVCDYGCDSYGVINKALKEFGVVCEGDLDEFDTIHLGRYRGMEDFKFNESYQPDIEVENEPKILKLTTTTPYSMFSDGSDVKLLVNRHNYGEVNYPFNTEKVMGRLYIHGDLEAKYGFDIPIFLEGDFPSEDGKYDVIFEPDHVECYMYIWFKKDQEYLQVIGLIVDKNDKESIEYAEEKFTEKSFIL